MSPPLYLTSSTFSISVAILLATPFLPTVSAQSNQSIPTFSTFDLLKNTDFQPCHVANSTQIVQNVLDKRRGGRSHSHGSGSSSGSGSSHTTIAGSSAMHITDLVLEAWSPKGGNFYCKFLNRTESPVRLRPSMPPPLNSPRSSSRRSPRTWRSRRSGPRRYSRRYHWCRPSSASS